MGDEKINDHRQPLPITVTAFKPSTCPRTSAQSTSLWSQLHPTPPLEPAGLCRRASCLHKRLDRPQANTAPALLHVFSKLGPTCLFFFILIARPSSWFSMTFLCFLTQCFSTNTMLFNDLKHNCLKTQCFSMIFPTTLVCVSLLNLQPWVYRKAM